MPRGYRLVDVMTETGASYAQLNRWRTLGLLPKVTLRGRYTTYPPEYLEQVRHIMDLYEGNLTALDIRDRLFPVEDP